jgi:chromosome segregation ATPase
LEREQELDLARNAQQVVEASREDYQRYQETEKALKQLRVDEQRRNKLRQQQGGMSNALAKIQTTIAHLQVRLDEVAAAKQRIIDLLPRVDEQLELEKQRDELTRNVAQYEELVKEGKRLVQQHADILQRQESIQRQISEIEPLQTVAAQLPERIEAVARLRAQLNERGSRQRLLIEKRDQLRQKQEERETVATRLRRAESVIAKIEEHRAEAEELPSLQVQYDQFSEQCFRLEGNIEGYTTSRQQSVAAFALSPSHV